jgi:hypothetical protein
MIASVYSILYGCKFKRTASPVLELAESAIVGQALVNISGASYFLKNYKLYLLILGGF